jgi:hypothetical protein
VLRDTALSANRQVWASVTCKHCERQGRYEINIPDYRVRLDAQPAIATRSSATRSLHVTESESVTPFFESEFLTAPTAPRKNGAVRSRGDDPRRWRAG